MFSDLEPYAEYVESGNSDQPRVPISWQSRRIKSILREVDRRSADGSERLLSLRASQGLVDHLDAGGKGVLRSDLIGYKIVEPGDLVMNRMRAAIGVFGLARSVGLVSPDYAVFVQKHSGNVDYLLELLRSRSMATEMRKRSRGMGTGESGFLRLYTDAFGAMRVPWPSQGERAAIVKYLGHANARIDSAIAAKRRLSGLIEEQWQTLIVESVTKGLDPGVPLKYSGVPWLGNVPGHWSVRKLRALFRGQGSGTTPPSDEDYGDEFPWIMSGDLNDSNVSSTKRSINHAALNRLTSLKLYPPESLVIAMYGATIGKNAISRMAATTNQACCVFFGIVVSSDVRYIQFAARVAKPGLLVMAFGGGQPNVNAEMVRQLRVTVPPLSEQQAIAAHLARMGQHATLARARLRDEIELLREFRTRLTSDVLTGQLDVREAAERLSARYSSNLTNTEDGPDDGDLDTEVSERLADIDA